MKWLSSLREILEREVEFVSHGEREEATVGEEKEKQMGEIKMNKRCPKINIKCSKSDLSRARHPRAEIRSLKTNSLD